MVPSKAIRLGLGAGYLAGLAYSLCAHSYHRLRCIHAFRWPDNDQYAVSIIFCLDVFVDHAGNVYLLSQGRGAPLAMGR